MNAALILTLALSALMVIGYLSTRDRKPGKSDLAATVEATGKTLAYDEAEYERACQGAGRAGWDEDRFDQARKNLARSKAAHSAALTAYEDWLRKHQKGAPVRVREATVPVLPKRSSIPTPKTSRPRNRSVNWRQRVRPTGKEWSDIRKGVISRDKRMCQHCGSGPLPFDEIHIDHIIPFSKGGSDTPKNLQVLCRECNLAKGAYSHPNDEGRGEYAAGHNTISL